MTGSIGRAAKLAAALLAATAVMVVASGSASATLTPIYNNSPAKLPGNFASLGFECCQVSQFGGEVSFLAPPTGKVWKNPSITVVLSSWACEKGTVTGENCSTVKGAKFAWPITFSVYEVGPGNSVGAKIAAGSKVFKIPYRPSVSAICNQLPEPGGWYDSKEGTCYHGFATKITFALKVAKLPANVIISFAYNTSDYGAETQRPKPCNSEPQGCPYDSLNVAYHEKGEAGNAPSVGSNPDPEEVYIASTYSALFCAPATASGSFEPSGPCWNEEQPVMKVRAQEGV
jgi:hypothetical protein